MNLVRGRWKNFYWQTRWNTFEQWNDLAIRQTRWNARRSRGPMEGSGAPREPVLPPFQKDCEKTSNIRIVILWRSALVEGRLAKAEEDAASKYLLHRTELPVAARTWCTHTAKASQRDEDLLRYKRILCCTWMCSCLPRPPAPQPNPPQNEGENSASQDSGAKCSSKSKSPQPWWPWPQPPTTQALPALPLYLLCAALLSSAS